MNGMLKFGVLALSLAIGCSEATAVDDSAWRGGPSESWFVNWDKALAEAKKTGKSLFVLNTGSDWCPWCKVLHEEVLKKPEFVEFASKKLVLVYLDSPYKSPLAHEQSVHNRRIADALGFGSGVPKVMVFTSGGMRLGEIGGGGLKLDAYLERLKSILREKGEEPGDAARKLFSNGYGKLAE